MDKKLVIVANACMILVILIAAIHLLPPTVHADDSTTVYLDPSLVSYTAPPITVGTFFNVSVWVNNVTDLCAYQIQIRYNATILNCTLATEPKSDPNYVLHSIVPLTMVTKSFSSGRATIGGSELPGNPAAHFTGTGLIAIFTFNITSVPLLHETLTSILNINDTEGQTFLLDSNGAQITPIDMQNGNYELGSDITSPTIDILSPIVSKVYNVTSIPLNFTVSEPVSWMGYSLDGAANVTITGNDTLTSLTESATPHTIVVYANDTSGNMGASSETPFKVDLSPPIIDDPTRVPAGDVDPGQAVVIHVNVTDAITAVKRVILLYTNDTTWHSITMNYNLTTHLYQATIPGYSAGTEIQYKITAFDMGENMAVNDNDGLFYTYPIIPEFSSTLMLFLFLAIVTFVMVLAKKKRI